jgi:pimeloyl-ACP methyl ester carboxylesterase
VTGPAPVTTARVDGLAITRRRPEDHDETAVTVALVHGAMDRGASFGRAMRRTGHLDVVAYDRRGYAGSLDAGVAESIEAHAADLATVIDWTGADRVVVVGHSLGGTIAAALVVAGDSRVLALGTYESPFPVLDNSFDEVGGGAVAIGEQQGPGAGAEHFYRLMVGDHTWSRLRERDRATRRAEGPALMAELSDLRRRDRSLDPRLVSQPVLVGMGGLSGERMRTGALLLSDRLPDATLDEIPNAGHGAHLTHPDEFARYIDDAVGVSEIAPGRPGTSLP